MKICPVCGYCELNKEPYDKKGNASFEICPSCGTEFGYDDAVRSTKELFRRWNELRKNWIKDGAKWLLPKYKPEKWKLEEQLRNLKKF